MRNDTSALRYVAAHHVAHETSCLGGFDVRDSAGDSLGTLDGFVVDSAARQVGYFVVEGHGWGTRRRYLVPIGSACMDVKARTLQLDIRGCKRLQTFEPDDFPHLSADEVIGSSSVNRA